MLALGLKVKRLEEKLARQAIPGLPNDYPVYQLGEADLADALGVLIAAGAVRTVTEAIENPPPPRIA